mmetsp:Transcript_75780/g.245504  ORF Transcript_75780/g.245504 Transcript_75780/m.245504 type:complete len:99 (+) Transcript_75780:50-346(+)
MIDRVRSEGPVVIKDDEDGIEKAVRGLRSEVDLLEKVADSLGQTKSGVVSSSNLETGSEALQPAPLRSSSVSLLVMALSSATGFTPHLELRWLSSKAV